MCLCVCVWVSVNFGFAYTPLAFPCRQYANLLSKSNKNSFPTCLFIHISLYFLHTASTRSLLLANLFSCRSIMSIRSTWIVFDDDSVGISIALLVVSTSKNIGLDGVGATLLLPDSIFLRNIQESRTINASQIVKAEPATIKRARIERKVAILSDRRQAASSWRGFFSQLTATPKQARICLGHTARVWTLTFKPNSPQAVEFRHMSSWLVKEERGKKWRQGIRIEKCGHVGSGWNVATRSDCPTWMAPYWLGARLQRECVAVKRARSLHNV